MITHIDSHGYQTPVIDVFPGVYVFGGNMLRMRAVYVHARDTNWLGRPCAGKQIFHAIVSSYHDNGKIQLKLSFLGGRGYKGGFGWTIPLPSVTWLGTRRWPFLMPLYRFWQKVLNPKRGGSPRWND